MKIVLTILVVLGWAWLVFANMLTASRTAGQMQLRDGITEDEARRRTTIVVLMWNGVLTVGAIVALIVILVNVPLCDYYEADSGLSWSSEGKGESAFGSPPRSTGWFAVRIARVFR